MTDLPPLDEGGDEEYNPFDFWSSPPPPEQPPETATSFMGNEITIYDKYGNPESHTKAQWDWILRSHEAEDLPYALDELQDMGHWDIMYALSQETDPETGLPAWDTDPRSFDWQIFREGYARNFGGVDDQGNVVYSHAAKNTGYTHGPTPKMEGI